MAECSSKINLLPKTDEEKTSLSAKHFPQYGTSSCYNKSKSIEDNTEFYIKHHVKENESLNSIALKYGLATSTLRRVNRLWNDNIFLCKQLLIPIYNRENMPDNFDGEIIEKSDLNKHMPKSKSVGRLADSTNSSNYFSNMNSPAISNCLHSEDVGDKVGIVSSNVTNHQDYFSKYDLSLAKIKCNIERLEKQTKFASAENIQPTKKKQSSKAKVSAVAKNSYSELKMKFHKSINSSKDEKLQEKFELLENEMFQL